MKIQGRIMLFLSIAFVILIITIASSYILNKKRQERHLLNIKLDRQYNIKVVMRLMSDGITKNMHDYSFWDDMVNFVKRPDSTWAKENINTMLNTLKVNYFWVYNQEFKQIYMVQDSAIVKVKTPLPKEAYTLLFDTIENSPKRACRYYIIQSGNLIEINGSTVHNTNDPELKKKPKGFFFTGRIINSAFLSDLKIATNNNVKSILIDSLQKDTSFVFAGMDILSIPQALKSWNQHTIAYFIFEKDNQFEVREEKFNQQTLFGYTSIIVLILILFYFLVATRISKSLSNISKTLNNEDIVYISELKGKKDEFGQIAILISNFFAQKQQLTNEIEERKRIETILKEINQTLVEQNEEINQQKEELTAQTEFLEKLNEEIYHQNDEIFLQKSIIEKKNLQTINSINYARRIQFAALPDKEYFKKIFPEHFVFFRPRDIVSGDFYWIKEKENIVLLAVADCTGHGVPGAFMSLLGISFLNELLNRKVLMHAGQILDRLRKHIMNALSQTGKIEEAHDGMNIALCLIDMESKELEFAGAYHPLWIVRNNSNLNAPELIEYKGEQMPIGYYIKTRSFTNYSIKLEDGDMIYLPTDGYTDQFGGPANRKFTKGRLKEILTLKPFNEISIEDKYKFLSQEFDDWKENKSQVDDVLLLGIKYQYQHTKSEKEKNKEK